MNINDFARKISNQILSMTFSEENFLKIKKQVNDFSAVKNADKSNVYHAIFRNLISMSIKETTFYRSLDEHNYHSENEDLTKWLKALRGEENP